MQVHIHLAHVSGLSGLGSGSAWAAAFGFRNWYIRFVLVILWQVTGNLPLFDSPHVEF